ncbi:glycosyltransferase family 9 protein [Shewanella sp. NIFS-20-20]|uniref:glycosyltransferase family 9 protein n=1 Tax=Shewanella sp. NIFS-20-20 TaxID=2853806 RepID=UPI001C495CB5|nr:glycosyltransferase family 9 protein [Shewanella sp. NIFS-20-20]MBV7316120.1 glycosyltransferase family 9 protein [Shewanella sp. NIFS-20-20]
MELEPHQSICILRLSAIGDVCHAVAMVQAIQRHYPTVAITWVIGKVEYQLLKHLPGVEFVIFDKSQGWRSYQQLAQALKGRKFDVLLHMQVALRASIASLFIKATTRIGFDKARAKEGQWLVTNQAIAAQRQPHVLDGFMGFAKKIGVTDLTPRWNIPVPEADTEFAKAHIATGAKVLIICPSASKAERNWLPERYGAIADYANERGLRVLLCGGPSDSEQQLATQIQAHCRAELTNLVGKTTLCQLLALLKRATVVIAPDTGPAHMAVTQGTAVIGLYAHSNPGRTGPYLSQERVVSVYEQVMTEQYPNQTMAWGTRAKGHELMAKISVEQVVDQLAEFVCR